MKLIKEQNDHIDQIPGVPHVLKGVDVEGYFQQPWKLNASPLPIHKKIKMSDLAKYDRIVEPQDHIRTYSTPIKENNFTKYQIKSILVKKFKKNIY